MSAPIRVRLTVLYVVVLAAIVAALIAFVVTRVRSDLTAELDRGLRDAAAQIAPAYRAEGPPEVHDTPHTVLPSSGYEPGGAQIVDVAGRAVVSEGAAPTTVPLAPPAARAKALAGQMVVIASRRVGGPSAAFA